MAELFEARRPKDHAIIAEIFGTIRFGNDFKNKQRLTIEPSEEGAEAVEALIPRRSISICRTATSSRKGEYIVDGNPGSARHPCHQGRRGTGGLSRRTKSRKSTGLQGVGINDKHIEVIVRQMPQKVDITDLGDTDLPARRADGRDRDLDACERQRPLPKASKPATGKPVLLGITKASLQTRSFISAALLPGDDARLDRSRCRWEDRHARRPEENVIVGRLIPAERARRVEAARTSADARHADPGAEGEASESAGSAAAGRAFGVEPTVRRERTKSAAE